MLQEENNNNNNKDVWYISRVLFHLPLKPHNSHAASACSVMAHLLNQLCPIKMTEKLEVCSWVAADHA